jgi:2-oxoglutarate ferredoxin oxidoreductase subunit gamma
MHNEIILAGFGGQGVLLIGKLLAYAGMKEGHQVTWMPAYGPEMRGGTCNCTVVISDKPIGAPITSAPHGLIVLNLPSLDKFESLVRPGGTIILNTTLVTRMPHRTDIVAVPLACNDMAKEAGAAKAANMVALGAFLGATGIVDVKLVGEILAETFQARPKLVPVNQNALSRGYEVGLKYAPAAAAR